MPITSTSRGKLIKIDRKVGMQAGVGVKFLAPEKTIRTVKAWARAATSSTIRKDNSSIRTRWMKTTTSSYSPEGGPIRGPKGIGRQGGQPGVRHLLDASRRPARVVDLRSGRLVGPARALCPARRFRRFRRSMPPEDRPLYVQNIYVGPA